MENARSPPVARWRADRVWGVMVVVFRGGVCQRAVYQYISSNGTPTHSYTDHTDTPHHPINTSPHQYTARGAITPTPRLKPRAIFYLFFSKLRFSISTFFLRRLGYCAKEIYLCTCLFGGVPIIGIFGARLLTFKNKKSGYAKL